MANICLLTDSYKLTHWKQYPPDTETVYSYFEARGGAYAKVLFFGLQYFLKKYLQWPVRERDVIEADALAQLHFGADHFNRAGWDHIGRDHGGYLPLRIRAVPEGSLNPIGTPLITVENTCPKCFWLTNYVETLLVQTWYPTTVATLSHGVKQTIARYLEATAENAAGLPFKLHDFGFRGVSSVESAGLGGCAHLVNFRGTDTLAALQVARDIYSEPCAGFSIPASEHSTITSWGRANERDAFANMLDQYPTGLVACVSDSYNIWDACEKLWGEDLKDRVLQRDGVLVVRPDSGDPKVTVLRVITSLMKAFGYRTNSKGFDVLNDKVRVIQGDGVNPASIDDILWMLKEENISADNVAFGMGGALLQQLHRDTCKMAFKCSAIKRKGVWHDVMKDPVTDPGKKSKAGRFELLPLTFEDGQLLIDRTLSDVRARAA